MSSLTDALMANMAASISPEAQAQRQLITNYVNEQKLHLSVTKSETMELIEQKLAKAIERGADPVVITAYQKLLTQVAS